MAQLHIGELYVVKSHPEDWNKLQASPIQSGIM